MRHLVPVSRRRSLALLLAALGPAAVLGMACQPTPSAPPATPEYVAAPAGSVAMVLVLPPAPSLAASPPRAVAAPAPEAAPPPAASDTDRMAVLVINPPTEAPLAPPPVTKLPALATMPALPHPSHYPAQPSLPTINDVEPCGVTWTGTEWGPNDCLDPNASTAQSRTAQVVVPYDRMPPLAIALPRVVDHRAEGTEGPVRHHHGNHCTAFAFPSALDHAYARWTGQPGSFSVMQIWARYHQNSEVQAAAGNVGDSLASEADWSYDGPLADTWRSCPTDPKWQKPGLRCAEAPDAAKLASLESRAVAELTQIEVIPLARLDVLREKLAAGMDVSVAIKLHSFATAGDAGAKYMLGETTVLPKKGLKEHQILLASYAMTPNGIYYLVHNSFGTHWGDAGFAWMHEDVLKAHIAGKVMIAPDVQPKEVAASGQLPDSISGQCANRCADGSPRHNNACAARTRECAAGLVNVTGQCVMAAPKSSGHDRNSGGGWTCGPAGCAYEVPGGTLGCASGTCAVSCPAPAFRLATVPSGLACVE